MTVSGPRVLYHHQLQKRRKKRKPPAGSQRPELSIKLILSWADAHHDRTGEWPNQDAGQIRDSLDDNWNAVNAALRLGLRGLTKGGSLAKLLAKERGVRNVQDLPRLTIRQILLWADAHHRRTGAWPTAQSGPIVEAPGERWSGVNMALHHGARGFRGGTTLLQLLVKHRHVRNRAELPVLQVPQILAWADAHHCRTGKWPVVKSGPITEAPEESWTNVDQALRKGIRGLPGGSSLAQVLGEHRSIRNVGALPRLKQDRILEWADAHRNRTGRWPTRGSGSIVEAPGETWQSVDCALRMGHRGLPADSSVARFLSEHRGVRNPASVPRLTPKQILLWADAFHHSTGQWPARTSGSITSAPGETWSAVDAALFSGRRGLPGGVTLSGFLKRNGRV
jgi:hypothetical protein